jgi:hypothetical protein
MFTKEQIVDGTVTVKPETLAALRRFRDLKTWKPENVDQKFTGMQVLASELAAIYEMPVQVNVVKGFVDEGPEVTDSGVPIATLPMGGYLSIITLLHNFAGLRTRYNHEKVGETFLSRQRWAVNTFRKVYPTAFSRLVFDNDSGFFFNSERMSELQSYRSGTIAAFMADVMSGMQRPVRLDDDFETNSDYSNTYSDLDR